MIVKIANGIKDLPGKGDVPALDGEELLRPGSNGQLRQRQWATPSSDLTVETSHARSLKASSSERAESSDDGYGNGESHIIALLDCSSRICCAPINRLHKWKIDSYHVLQLSSLYSL